ncbi:hypothetical protein Ssi03_26820 [Sphaerisporangium siamense]|uniref:Uncharacterized protein n=1 Tax=Sphaerisporangium siamense TaxID=795645 RepID=A0A7W7D458_9ACTN|nr:hypothetical protein [Sphaerisporangium siamense]MBB4699989.1 hypothetical protein [Sphaerisporangium siamense]GII84692.1 hypothetical protein Ssi03_26820 [Sphaerisporangium siamense]
MYGWLWRAIPGGTLVKLATVLALTGCAGVVLWYVVFPMLEPHVPLDRATIGR